MRSQQSSHDQTETADDDSTEGKIKVYKRLWQTQTTSKKKSQEYRGRMAWIESAKKYLALEIGG